jgi:3-dehydroquinate dehydratase I
MQTALSLHPGMIELRFDLLDTDISELLKLVTQGTAVIATCRPGKMDEESRMQLLKEAMDQGVKFIDIEIDAGDAFKNEMLQYARQRKTEVILSWHDFEKTPSLNELVHILDQCYAEGADIAKIACAVQSDADNANLLSLYAKPGRKVILGMGARGKITRVAALQLGAEFTFTAPDRMHATAPGQLTYSEFDAINKILLRS